MKVYKPVPLDMFMGGITISREQQRKALETEGVQVVTDPDTDYDILHADIPDPFTLFRVRQAKRAGKPVIMHTHVTHSDFRNSFRLSNVLYRPLKWYLRSAYGYADCLIAPTEYTRTVVEEYGADNVVVISNGIDTDRLDGFEEMRDAARDRFELEQEVVFNIGTVLQRKAPDDFVAVAREFPDMDFAWFGTRLSRLLTQHGTDQVVSNAPGNTVFTGFVDDVRTGYGAGDIFFMPTREENQGIPALEAAYCGKPVVIRDIPVFDTYFEHEYNCLKADSVNGFVKQIRRLQEDEELRQRIVQNARDTAEQHRLPRIGTRLREVYENTLEAAE